MSVDWQHIAHLHAQWAKQIREHPTLSDRWNAEVHFALSEICEAIGSIQEKGYIEKSIDPDVQFNLKGDKVPFDHYPELSVVEGDEAKCPPTGNV